MLANALDKSAQTGALSSDVQSRQHSGTSYSISLPESYHAGAIAQIDQERQQRRP